MSRSTSVLLKGILLAFVIAGVTGCASGKLKAENEALKAQVSSLTERVQALDGETSRLAEEKVGIETELSKTRADYAAKQAELEATTKKLKDQGFEVSMKEGRMVVTMPAKILYPSGSADLSSAGKDKLRQLSKALNEELKGFYIEIQGHTDTDPIQRTKDKYKSNWELSYDRAQTVAYYLIKSCSVDPKRLHVGAYGEYRAVASNAAADGKARNRRVEIVVMQ